MWRCPKCGREFNNASNTISAARNPKTIDEYIAGHREKCTAVFSPDAGNTSGCAAEAQSVYPGVMPTYWKKQNIIHFAGHKTIWVIPGEKASSTLRTPDRLQVKQSAIQCRQHPSLELVAKIAKWCMETGNHH